MQQTKHHSVISRILPSSGNICQIKFASTVRSAVLDAVRASDPSARPEATHLQRAVLPGPGELWLSVTDTRLTYTVFSNPAEEGIVPSHSPGGKLAHCLSQEQMRVCGHQVDLCVLYIKVL